MIELIIIDIILGILVGFWASSKERSFWTYTLLSIFLSPLIGIIVLLVQGDASEKEVIRNNKHMLYCKHCNSTYSGKGGRQEWCAECQNVLMETSILLDDWKTFDDSKKAEMKKAFSEGQYAIENVGKTVVITNYNEGADEIKKYKELLDMGAITEEEYEAKKKQILNL